MTTMNRNCPRAHDSRLTWLRVLVGCVLAVLCWLPTEALAQGEWATASGTTNIHNTNSGNVGIGTASPSARLQIQTVINGEVQRWFSAANGNAAGQIGLSTYAEATGASLLFGPNNYWDANGGIQRYNTAEEAWGLFMSNRASQDRFAILRTSAGGATSELFTLNNNGNVGIGTATPQTNLHINQVPGNATGILLSGEEYYQSGNGSATDGVLLLLGVNRPGNRQLWFGTSSALGSPTSGFLRTITGTTMPMIDGVSGDGLSRLPLSLGAATTNVGIGFGDELMGNPGSKLSVVGGVSVGVNYRNTASPLNGLLVEGNVGIGTTALEPNTRLHVEGNVHVNGNIGARYQDIAEWVPTRQQLAPGTVVSLDPAEANHVRASSVSYDTSVAGVVSARPGLILGEGGEGRVMVATTGRVRVRVDATTAPIRVGDLLVTSEREGYAMRSEPMMISGRPFHSPGTLIGKALEPLAGGIGEILVLLSLQ